MSELPPFIKGIIEGGKSKEEFSESEIIELQEALAALSPESRSEVEAMLAPSETDEFIFKSDESNLKSENEH